MGTIYASGHCIVVQYNRKKKKFQILGIFNGAVNTFSTISEKCIALPERCQFLCIFTPG